MHTELKVELVKLEKLIPYAANARTHNDMQVAQIAASIKEYGWTNPVLIDGADGIIAGHGRVLAARKLGITDVPCIRLGHLTDSQRRAYVIADNKLALNAGWDEDLLRSELAQLKGEGVMPDLIGFSQDELDKLLDETNDLGDMGEAEDEQGKPTILTCPKCGCQFSLQEGE
jgi:ParB-like chromosome segregation protein Spo0J